MPTPRAIVRAWLDSPEHRANLLNQHFRRDALVARQVMLRGVGAVWLYVHALG